MSIAESRIAVMISFLALAAGPGGARGNSAQDGRRSVAVEGLGGREVSLDAHWRRRPASLGIENAYRDLLRSWGTSAVSVVRYAEVQALVTERIAGVRVRARNYEYEEVRQGIRCLAAVEQNTADLVGGLDPELYLVLSTFHLGIHNYLTTQGLYWLADENWSRLDWLRRHYRTRPEAPPALLEDRLAALETTVGGRLLQFGLIGQLERSRESFQRALKFGPDSDVGHYWLGFLEEKLGYYRRAEPHFEWLVERNSADREAALRSAINLARLDREKEAIERLEDLIGFDSPSWIRVVAVQELARLHAPIERETAVKKLRQVRASLPDQPSLTIQLAQLLGDRSAEGETLLLELAGNAGSPGPSPRLLYEEGRTEALERRMAEFEGFVIAKLPDLVTAIDTIERLETVQGALKRHGSARPDGFRTGFENPNRERPVFQDCSRFKLPRK